MAKRNVTLTSSENRVLGPQALHRPGDAATTPAISVESRESRAVLILLTVFVLIAVLWAFTIPIPSKSLSAAAWDAYNPDEQFHMKYVAYLATHFSLPVPWTGTLAQGSDLYTAVHPPLYYALFAPLFLVCNALFGIPVTFLVFRVVGAFIGAGTVYLTYRTARVLFPHDISLFSAAVVAGIPMFVSLSASTTNEVAAAFAASGALLMLAHGVTSGFDRRRILLSALWITAGLAIKVTNVALIPAALLAILIAPEQAGGATGPSLLTRFRNALILVCVPIIGIGWWFVRNLIIYGDALQARQHYAYWSTTVKRPWWTLMGPIDMCIRTAFIGWQAFWGYFDAFSRAMPDTAYYAIMALQLPAFFGIVYFIWRGGMRPGPIWRSALVYLLFTALVQAVFFAVNWRIYCPQGRYLFPLVTPFGIATAVGWTAFWPPKRRSTPIAVGLLLLLVLNVFALTVMPIRPDTH